MRTLTDHKVNGLNEALQISVLDEPGVGGASHQYLIHTDGQGPNCAIQFQQGNPSEVGINGVSMEALLTINIDRLRGFQRGPFATHDNATALQLLEVALHLLQLRTLERLARGVEGAAKS